MGALYSKNSESINSIADLTYAQDSFLSSYKTRIYLSEKYPYELFHLITERFKMKFRKNTIQILLPLNNNIIINMQVIVTIILHMVIFVKLFFLFQKCFRYQISTMKLIICDVI